MPPSGLAVWHAGSMPTVFVGARVTRSILGGVIVRGMKLILMFVSKRGPDPVVEYNATHIPREGEVIDVRDATPDGPRVAEFEHGLLVVTQVIHALGPESHNHRVLLKVRSVIDGE